MEIIIDTPYALNEIGGRSNNEDSIFPKKGKATSKDKLFLVCDGVGGSNKGEAASRLACESLVAYFTQNPVEQSDEAYIDEAVKYTEAAFDTYLEQNPEAKGMATTLTLLHLHSGGATIAHVGDSRIYQFHKERLIQLTSDHSLVNELLKEGKITEEEARNHPEKNVITQAVQGSEKPAKADVKIINDINAGDYFFLCTDGILENMTDFEIETVLAENINDQDKIQTIRNRCLENPHDNFSAYLIPVKKVEKNGETGDDKETEVSAETEMVTAEIIEENEPVFEGEVQEPVLSKAVKSILGKLFKLKNNLPLVLIIAGLFFGIYRWKSSNNNPVKPAKAHTETGLPARKQQKPKAEKQSKPHVKPPKKEKKAEAKKEKQKNEKPKPQTTENK